MKVASLLAVLLALPALGGDALAQGRIFADPFPCQGCHQGLVSQDMSRMSILSPRTVGQDDLRLDPGNIVADLSGHLIDIITEWI